MLRLAPALVALPLAPASAQAADISNIGCVQLAGGIFGLLALNAKAVSEFTAN